MAGRARERNTGPRTSGLSLARQGKCAVGATYVGASQVDIRADPFQGGADLKGGLVTHVAGQWLRRVSGPTRVEPLQPKETLSAPPTDQRNGLNPPLPANAVRYPSELSCGDPSRRADPSFPCAVRSIRVCIAGDGLGRCVDRISALLSPDPFLFRPGPVTRSVNSIFADREVSNQSRRFGYSQVTS